MVVRRFIMCRTRPVLSFDVDDVSGECISTGTILDWQRLPRELISHGKPAVYARRINTWWHQRAIPPTRDGLRRALGALGVDSATELLERSHGLSLSDQYWVKDETADLTWEDVNFFHHPFNEEVGRVMLTLRSSSHQFNFAAPDASTGGDLAKRWTISKNGERLLIKGARSGQEPINELIASRLAQRLHISAVDYQLGEENNRPVSVCADMLTDTEELIAAWPLIESVKTRNQLSARDAWLYAAELFGCDLTAVSQATDGWLLVDWLMRNIDRHYNNFGLIRDVETLQVRPAPIFDTGASLWCGELRIDTGDYMARPFYTTQKNPTARRQLNLINDWSRFDLDALAGWPDEVAERLSTFGVMSSERIAAIVKALQGKIIVAQQVKDSAK